MLIKLRTERTMMRIIFCSYRRGPTVVSTLSFSLALELRARMD